jgi:putative tricarboxylic transport membrane protein
MSRAPCAAIMPVIVVLGAFATGDYMSSVTLVAAFGVIGFVMERDGFQSPRWCSASS